MASEINDAIEKLFGKLQTNKCAQCHGDVAPATIVTCHVFHPSSTPGADQGAIQPQLLEQILKPTP